MFFIGRITSARVYIPHDNVRGETLLVSTCFNHLPLSCHFVAMRTPWMGLVILLVFAPDLQLSLIMFNPFHCLTICF